MKVLLLCPMTDGQTGPAWKHALEKLSHKVVAVDAKLAPQNSYGESLQFKPDLIFCSRTPALAEEVIKIKQMFKDSVACMWNVDTRYFIKEWIHLFPLIRAVDYHFVVEFNLLDKWRKLNSKTFWLPQGLQDEIYDKPQKITEEDKRKYSCDVCFCGSVGGPYRVERALFLKAIREAGFKLNVWGSGGKLRIYNEEHNKQVALAKINLGCSGWPENEKYSSVRNYKIMGAGGFLLEFNRKGIYELFPTDTLGCYMTLGDLVKKIGYWLEHKGVRKQIAERGYRWVRAEATYTHRIKMMLEIMGMK